MASPARAEPDTEGIVYLAGAGPGDPRLITMRALDVLRSCDVVVYDSLVNPILVAEAPAHAERIAVGKTAVSPRISQDEIHRVLIDRARQRLRVVRLKGGDPFVFGRGGEEGLALASAGIAFEVIPGVSSAVAAAAYAGIPLTHRGIAPSFAVVTGHCGTEADLPWSELARGASTLVFLMGTQTLPTIAERLVAHGRAADTPVAVVHWGTTARQRTVTGTLADIAAQVQKTGLRSPTVIIIGEVVTLRESLAWFERLPLFGWTVILTRPRGQNDAFERKLTDLGADVVCCPMFQTKPVEDWGPVDAALAQLETYDWLILTSASAVGYFWERLAAQGRDTRALGRCRVVAVGPATAEALATHGVRADLVPVETRQEGIAALLEPLGLADARVLFPRAEGARRLLAERLHAAGAVVDSPVLYRTIPVADAKHRERIQEAAARSHCALTFASSSAVDSFVSLMGNDWPPAHREHVLVACIGPQTAHTATNAGFTVHVQPETSTVPAFVDALVAAVAGAPD